MPGENCAVFGCRSSHRKRGIGIWKMPKAKDETHAKWRNKKDEGFKPEFQGVDKKKIEFSLVRSILLRKMLKYVSMALISRMICIHDMLFTMLQLHLDAQMFSWFLLSSSCSCDFFVCSSK